jgi:hypothetical protein
MFVGVIGGEFSVGFLLRRSFWSRLNRTVRILGFMPSNWRALSIYDSTVLKKCNKKWA